MLGSAAALVVFAGAASAGAFTYDQSPYKVLVKTTGNNSELTDHLDITSTQGASPKVVMSLPLPSLLASDRVNVNSELEVTTDCIDSTGHCGRYADGVVGKPYTYNPYVDTQLLLASSSNAASGTPITDLSQRQCRQERPSRNHHCTLVFPDAGFNVPAGAALSCPLNGCYVNLVASAWNSSAEAGDRLIVGEDQHDGSTLQDKGRINAVRVRPDSTATQPVQSLSTSDLVSNSLPIGDTSIYHAVVLSQRLDNLKTDEQLAVSANMDTDISALPYNVLIQSKLILTSSRTATAISDSAVNASTQQGEVAEANGFNCTHFDKTVSLSPWDTPCQTQKVGVSRMLANSKKLYLNLVVGTEAIQGTPATGDRVRVTGGNLHVVRLPASRKG